MKNLARAVSLAGTLRHGRSDRQTAALRSPCVGSRDDAEDVIQEAYLRVLRYSVDHGVEDMERLLSAAKNLAIDSIRRHRTRDITATSSTSGGELERQRRDIRS